MTNICCKMQLTWRGPYVQNPEQQSPPSEHVAERSKQTARLRWEHGRAVWERSHASRSRRGLSERIWRWVRNGWRNNLACLSIGTLEGVRPSVNTRTRETRKARLLLTCGTPMTIIVESSNIAMDFVLAVRTDLGIPRTTAALSLNALHVRSLAIRTNHTEASRWCCSDCGILFL